MWVYYTFIFASVTVELSYQFNIFKFPAKCDFQQGLYIGPAATPNMDCSGGKPCVTWKSGLNGQQNPSNFCSRQGVLKVSPGSGTQKTGKMNIYISMYQQKDWTFNIGDSSTVNGWGGDAGTAQGWVAEIHNINDSLLIYENVAWKAVGPPVPGQVVRDYFSSSGPLGFSTFNVNITKCNEVSMDRIDVPRSKISIWEDHMYKFDDVYVGLNRVVGSSYRKGIGACAVCVVFESYSKSACNAPGHKYGTGPCSTTGKR